MEMRIEQYGMIFLVGALFILAVLIFYSLLRRKDKKFEQVMTVQKSQEEQFEKQMAQIQEQLHKVREEQTLSQSSMEVIGQSLLNIHKVMVNTKQRGNWGEYQLDHLLEAYTAKNPSIYELQYTLNNGRIADAILHVVQEDKIVCIDAKFPMDAYLAMEEDKEHRQEHLRAFVSTVKKQIQDISMKYITSETLPMALMFIPSEAIYQFICANGNALFLYAMDRHVQIVSPTTLAPVLYSIMDSARQFYRRQNINQLQKDLVLLLEEVRRMAERSSKAERMLENALDQIHKVSISANKVEKRIESFETSSQEDRS